MLFVNKDYHLRRLGQSPNFYMVKIATQFFQIIIVAILGSMLRFCAEEANKCLFERMG
jgi:hypothetical protein